MNYINVLRIIGLISGVITGGFIALQGDAVTGGGIVAASLSTVGRKARPTNEFTTN